MHIPPIISVDDHVVEPPELWTSRLPAKLVERGPRVVRAPYEMVQAGRHAFRMAPSGPETDFWVYDGAVTGVDTASAAAGLSAEGIATLPIAYREMRPGCYEARARLDDMDAGGIERSLCFPTFPRFCGQTFLDAEDKELALLCVRAYNDWMVDEWTAGSGGRLLPLCLVPLWDAELAANEVRRNASRGVRAVAFSELPQFLGLPSLHNSGRWWDPLLRACDETGTVMCMHIGSASRLVTTADDAPLAAQVALLSVNSQLSLTDWLISGTLVRFPNLKIAFSEGQVGWMPYLLQRLDMIWERHAGTLAALDPIITQPPSSYLAGRIFGCVVDDAFGIRARDVIGVDQITFESDYPHMDSTWPNTATYASEALVGFSEEDVYKVIRGNAIELFQLEEALKSQPNRQETR
jgi:predicted TIM-barrel fold metal-dependent hydrolase